MLLQCANVVFRYSCTPLSLHSEKLQQREIIHALPPLVPSGQSTLYRDVCPSVCPVRTI